MQQVISVYGQVPIIAQEELSHVVEAGNTFFSSQRKALCSFLIAQIRVNLRMDA